MNVLMVLRYILHNTEVGKAFLHVVALPSSRPGGSNPEPNSEYGRIRALIFE